MKLSVIISREYWSASHSMRLTVGGAWVGGGVRIMYGVFRALCLYA